MGNRESTAARRFSEWLSRFRLRLSALFRLRQLDDDLEGELAFHQSMREAALRESGESPASAAHSARRRFGNATSIKEACRDLWTFRWLEDVLQDVRFGARILARSPGFTAVAVLSLALGIGANTAIFTVVDAMLIESLPVRDPEELVVVNWSAARSQRIHLRNAYKRVDEATGKRYSNSFPSAIYERFRAESDELSHVFAFTTGKRANVSHDGNARIVPSLLVSGNYYRGLGVRPVAGRLIDDNDDKPGASPVAVLSYQFWQQVFSGSDAAIGSAISVNGQPVTVIGITPPEFYGVSSGGILPSPDVTLPLAWQPRMVQNSSGSGQPLWREANVWWINIMGRRAAHATQESVRAELTSLFLGEVRSISESHGLELDQPGIHLLPGAQGIDTLRWRYSRPLWILLAVAGLILLIACANLANLLLARATARRQEIAVRLAMGAGRFRIARLMLTESLLLSGIGGALGLLLSYWGSGALLATLTRPAETVRLSLEIDWRIAGFCVAISLVTGILFGLGPSFRASQVPLGNRTAVSSHPRAGHRPPLLRHSLVCVQVGLSLVLLIGAGLFLRSLDNLNRVDLGFQSERLLLFRIQPMLNGYRDTRALNLYTELTDRLSQLPGVVSVSGHETRLAIGAGSNGPMFVPDAPHLDKGRTQVYINEVDSGFFETMGIPLVMGRGFRRTDTAGAPLVAVINQTAARSAFPNGSPVGRRVSLRSNKNGPNLEIVGLARDAKFAHVREDNPPMVYLPYAQDLSSLYDLNFAVRTAGPPEAILGHVREVVRQLDPNLPLADVSTQRRQIDDQLRFERLFAGLSTAFGILALALACIGIYGVMVYSVARRTSEIGLRMALGARHSGIVWLILRQLLAPTLVGVAVGLAGALAASRTVTAMLYRIESNDPLTIAAAVLILLTVAILAALRPALRAASTKPMDALRSE